MTRPDVVEAGLVLPRSVADLLQRVACAERHPGLQLDKFSPLGKQDVQRYAVERACGATGDATLLSSLSLRRSRMFERAGARRFRAVTAGPLTLHLARASGLENAGIHLHPVYGFACLPGSGLKGMARAYAETVWVQDQPDPGVAWKDILAVFGWAVRSESTKSWKPSDAAEPEGSHAGAVVFHDAWPTEWPRLQPDIVNNHHTTYYQGEGDPGDWEEPNMVSFLSVAEGITFDFAVAARAGTHDRFLTLALAWLQGALVHEGAGAKTSAGYGRFRLPGLENPAPPVAARCRSVHVLELATPAFLGGAKQGRDDCDLRPATLRGLLRWWWRTMHAAHLDRKNLRCLETAIWGDAQSGAALALSLRSAGPVDRQLFDKHDIAQRSLGDAKGHTGIHYLAYGMDETKRRGRVREQRWFVVPGTRWTVTLSARQGRLDSSHIPAAEVLRQGVAALWLLCRYGGVGSKSRKGFGSFADLDTEEIAGVEESMRVAANLRRAVGVAEPPPRPVRSSSLDEMLSPLEATTPWCDPWFALGQLGGAIQGFARQNAHETRKIALGLPRQIHGPTAQPMRHQNRRTHRPPKKLSVRGRVRHAAPVHYHLAPEEDGTLTVRMTAFPSPGLPDIETSRNVLNEIRTHVQTELVQRKRTHGNRGKRPVDGPAAPRDRHGDRPGVRGSVPRARDQVDAVLLAEKTRKGGWKAKHKASGLQGPIRNAAEVPADAEPGQRVMLVVASVSANQRELHFRWPAQSSDARASHSNVRGRRRDRSSRQRRGKR